MDAICGLTGRLAAELSDSVEGVVFFADTADRAACEQLLTGLGLLRLKKLSVCDAAMGDLLAGTAEDGRPIYGKKAEALLTLTLSAGASEGELCRLFAEIAGCLLFNSALAVSELARGVAEYDVRREVWRTEISIKAELLLLREDEPLWTAAELSARVG